MSTGQAGDEARATVGVHRGWAAIRPDHPARHGQDVPAFLRMMGLWWGDQLSLLRILASGPMASPPEPNPP